jgi:hypothetical protein
MSLSDDDAPSKMFQTQFIYWDTEKESYHIPSKEQVLLFIGLNGPVGPSHSQ